MFTPQEVSERGFTKVSFGGYNMVQVDEFLDVLTGDYTTLYSENTALKRKMKVLQDKIDEYRTTEETMRKALLAAQEIAENMVQEGKSKTQKLMDDTRQEMEALRKSTLDERLAEEQRLASVKQMTAQYVEQVRALHQKEMEYLDSLGHLIAHDPEPSYAPDVVAPAAPQYSQPVQAAPPPPPQNHPQQAIQQSQGQQGIRQAAAPQSPIQPSQAPQQNPQPMPDSSAMSNDVQAFLERAMANALGEKKAAEITADESYRHVQGVYTGEGDGAEATTRFMMQDDYQQTAVVGSRPFAGATALSEDSEYDSELEQGGNRVDWSRLQQEFGQQS